MATESTALRSLDENARRQFESAWRAARPEPIERFLPDPNHPHYLPTLEELIAIDLEFRWKRWREPAVNDVTPRQERPPLVESYLARFPHLQQPQVLERLLEQEFRVRQRHGDRPALADYQRRFPDVTLGVLHEVTTARGGSGPAPSAPEPEPGAVLGRYRLSAKHARGGFGLVWRADDQALGREVALKQLSYQLAIEPSYRQRFVSEARIAAQLQHPGIVPVYDVGDGAAGDPYYTMKLVRGQTFSEAIRLFHEKDGKPTDRPVEYLRLLNAFLSVTRAMAYAHSRRVIHRDLKPDNILLGDFGETVILDWGLAKVLDAPVAGVPGQPHEHELPKADSALNLHPSSEHETVAGTVMGTPAYMAPEQAAGRIGLVDELSDVYALGAMLYQVLSGKPPFRGTTSDEVLTQVMQAEPPSPRALAPHTPRQLEAICLKAMAKERGRRYASAADLARDLERYLADEPIRAYRETRWEALKRWGRRHRTIVATGLVALFLIMASAAGGVLLLQDAEQKRRQRDLEENTRTELRRQREAQELQASAVSREQLALADLHADQWTSAEKLLGQAVERLEGQPELDELRGRLEKRHGRARRLEQYYRYADLTEKLAFLEYDEEALLVCTRALDQIGVLSHKLDWWQHLPIDKDELNPDQASRLQEDVYRTLLYLAVLNVKNAIVNLHDPPASQAYLRAAVEAVEVLHRRQMSKTGRILVYMCRKILGEPNNEKFENFVPTSTADYYFLGIAQVWLSSAADNDALSKGLKLIFGQLPQGNGLDLRDPRAMSERMLRTAITGDPRHYWANFWLGWSFSAARYYRAAELAFNTCVAVRPNQALGFSERAQALLRQRLQVNFRRGLPFVLVKPEQMPARFRELQDELERRVLSDLERAAALEPNEPWIHWLRMSALYGLAHWEDSTRAALRAVELERPLRAWEGHFYAYEQRKSRLEEARNLLAQPLTRAWPQYVEGWLLLASIHWALASDDDPAVVKRNEDAALQAVDHALRLNASTAAALAIRGAVQTNRRQFAQALTDFRAALAIDPGNPLAQVGEAQALEGLGERDQALATYDRVLAQPATNWKQSNWHRREVELGRARLLLTLRRPTEALTAFEKVAQTTGTIRQRMLANLGRAQALLALGRPAELAVVTAVP